MIVLGSVPEPADLVARLDFGPHATLPVATPTALFVNGVCFHRRARLARLELVVDDRRFAPTAWRMPRLDVARAEPGQHSYRSGFWATLPIAARSTPGAIEIGVAATPVGGAEIVVPLGRVEVVAAPEPPPVRAATIAIAMATFDPDMALFAVQIESLRAQTERDWVCVISDDGSAPERYAQMEATLAGDERFVLSRAPARLGPYRNFERALELVPAAARLVALCDQDDRWHPEKLATLRAALGSAQLVYSDQRLVDASGTVLAQTLWEGRRNDHESIASMLVANTVTGAAALFTRDVLERALPFPEPSGWPFHDHWIALVALASGEVAYVDRPLYDYVQHERAVVGHGGAGRNRAGGWRAAYFVVYLPRAVMARVLLARCADRLPASKRRALERFVAAESSPRAWAWLALRPLRALVGRGETLGSEAELARGILWRHLVALRAWPRETPGRGAPDASTPPLTADTLGQRRLGRWRASRG
jgi:glycosyltransferase involved in cell wall biosynthesis